MNRIFTYDQKIVPYVRMTQRGKFVKHDAREYLASQEQLAWSFHHQMQLQPMVPRSTPFEIELEYHAPNIFQFDLDNLIKAVLDAAKSIIFSDDRWCQFIRNAAKYRGENYSLMFLVREIEK
jgi:crossover junction endodeoxyribonuclease RusA